MLQPEQLKHVTERYAREIAELRDFFRSAGIQTGRADGLPAVTDRLSGDRTFQRDLMSHVWVILHAHGPAISFADLLATVALAAAGPGFATEARDTDAQDLLRFLMQARRSLENGPSLVDDPSGNRAQASAAQLPEVERHRLPSGSRLPSGTADVHERSSLKRGTRTRGVALLLLAICVAAAIIFTIRLRERTRATVTSTLPPGHPIPKELKPDIHPKSPPATTTMPTPKAAPGHDITQHVSVAASPAARDFGPGSPGITEGKVTVPATTVPPRSLAADAGKANETTPRIDSAPLLVKHGTAVPAAIPSAVLSQQLGARTLPPDYGQEDRSYNAKYPRLLRRRPLLPLADERSDTTEQVARNEPSALFREDSSRGAIAMTVRPVSLGTMAANVLYSPAPAYPPAAAAARVQGEVKVQAEVDRDGNVAFARVISGPALLRDAAVDAVQRWRYRPYLSAGRAVAMSATAVLEFQLQ